MRLLRSDRPFTPMPRVRGFFIRFRGSAQGEDAGATRVGGGSERTGARTSRRRLLSAIGAAALVGLLAACQSATGPGGLACGFSASVMGPTTVAVGLPVQFQATWTRADPSIDVTVSWTFTRAPGSMATLIDSGLNATFTPDVVGLYTIGFRVREAGSGNECGAANEHTIVGGSLDVQATTLNADAGPDQNVDVGSTVTLDGSNSIGTNLTYTWSTRHQLGTSSAPSGGAGPILSFTLDEPDSLVYQLLVVDGSGNRDSTLVEVVSNPPTITSLMPSSGPVGTRVKINGTNFHPTPSQNTVTFGTINAAVVTASSTLLEADVPIGAITAPVTVTVSPTNHMATGPTFTVSGAWTLVSSMVPGGSLDDVSFPTAMVGYAVGKTGASQVPVLIKSTDGGSSWTATTIPGGVANSGAFGVSFTHPDTGTVVGQFDQIFRTEDGGATWAPQTTQAMNAAFADVSFVDGSIGVAVGRSNATGVGIIVRTTDGGATQWASLAGPNVSLFAVHIVSAMKGWTVGAAGTIMATTNGTTWSVQTNVPAGLGALTDVFFLDGLNGWAVGTMGIGGPVVLFTVNGGNTWNFTAGQPPGNSDLRGVSFTDTMTGVVVGFNGIFRTTDGGATWIDESGSAKPNRVALKGSTGVAVGGPGGGANAALWKRQ